MEYFSWKRPIISTIIAFFVFSIFTTYMHDFKNILYWIGMSFILALIVGVVSLRTAIDIAKTREKYEKLKKEEKKSSKENIIDQENSTNSENNICKSEEESNKNVE